ncbi:xyloglucan galactosyltransferase KATAMARI1 homolog [Solanum tuberosum]|uniref:Xyloglucan galactosyltransferase KATAMARI1 n=1 Tax=Solanum tuberosum TaxID=4113 RepID=M0ZK47_SOLTU|nr:PREDICTED: xyloglucan galactosyltransferase KATAMARI1 homolog [Solanum tuberosum]
MLPSENSSPRKTFKKLRNSFHLIKSQVGFHHCKWFFLIILIQVTFILFLAGTSPPAIPLRHQHQHQQQRFQISKPQKQSIHQKKQSNGQVQILQDSKPKNKQQKQSKDQLQILQDLKPKINQQKQLVQAKEPHDECEYGRVYVYDLPTKFNKDLLNNCHDLDPWSSRCNAVSNGGLGPKATGLDSIIPENIRSAWYWTDMYSAEVIYHERILNYKCRTLNPQNATAFYIPFYAGLAIGKILWFTTAKERDRPSELMLEWVKDQPYWNQNHGSDHFLMLGRLTWAFRRKTNDDSDWGTSFLRMPLMKNVLRLSIEKNPWDDLEVSVPYPTAFHPQFETEIKQWQDLVRSRNRSSHFCFVGAVRKKIKNDFREVLMNYCKNETGSCKIVDCSVTHCYDGAPAILEAFLDSDFCLQPKGDGFTRRSMFDCMMAGSIPVYFWKGSFKTQYEWHLPSPSEDYSVYMDHTEVRNDTNIIREVLDKFTKDDVKKMREILIDAMPKYLYARSNQGLGSSNDAFDIAIDEVLKRFKQQREQKQNLEETRKDEKSIE